jgi:hypothetical protein
VATEAIARLDTIIIILGLGVINILFKVLL